MPAGKYLYRLLREDEDPSNGLSARNPEAKDAKISSHVNGLKESPYISTTATKQAIQAYYWLAEKKNEKKNEEKNEKKETQKQKKFTVVKIDKDKLLKENKGVEVFDLSDEATRDKYLAGNNKLQNYAAKYEEVLIQGFVPANCITVEAANALFDSAGGYEESDYTPDEIESLVSGASKLTLK